MNVLGGPASPQACAYLGRRPPLNRACVTRGPICARPFPVAAVSGLVYRIFVRSRVLERGPSGALTGRSAAVGRGGSLCPPLHPACGRQSQGNRRSGPGGLRAPSMAQCPPTVFLPAARCPPAARTHRKLAVLCTYAASSCTAGLASSSRCRHRQFAHARPSAALDGGASPSDAQWRWR